jgi:hypothetical protein
MAAIPILIGISLLYPSEGAVTFQPLHALAAVAAVVAGKYLMGYLLGWIAKNGSRELFVGTALLVVIVVMEGMTLVGVSAGLGAFIAGVMLASSEYRHELEADLRWRRQGHARTGRPPRAKGLGVLRPGGGGQENALLSTAACAIRTCAATLLHFFSRRPAAASQHCHAFLI